MPDRPRRSEVLAAVLLALARLALGFAVLLGTLASYAWWGSPRSPLGELWPAAVACAVLWLVFWLAHREMLRRIWRWHARKVRAHSDSQQALPRQQPSLAHTDQTGETGKDAPRPDPE